jgi:outer membrane protein TolC
MFPEETNQTITFALSLQQPLFAQGKVTVGLKIAETYRQSLICKYEAARQSVKATTTNLFYGALLAKQNWEILNEATLVTAEVHRLAVVRFSIGKASEIDTLGTRLGLEKAYMDVRDAEGKKRTSYEALIKQSGVQEKVQDFSVEGGFPEGDDYHITLEEALAKLHRNSKQIGQLKGGEDVQRFLVRLEKTNYLPMVYCGGSLAKFGMFNDLNDIEWYDDQKVFVGLTVNLSSGGTRLNKLRQAQSDYRRFVLTREQTVDGLEIAVRNASEKLETSRAQLASARALVAMAERAYGLSKKAYEIGSMTLLELQQREIDLKNARMALNAAQFGFHSSVIDLKLLMGDLALSE